MNTYLYQESYKNILENFPHRFTLIGISNSGKSYWARKLEGKGYKYFHLDLEGDGSRSLIQELNKMAEYEKVVIDTTENFLNINSELLSQLQRLTKIILLDIPESIQKGMSYPKLLQKKDAYKKYADITLNYYLLRSKNFSTENFINIISGNF
ncbi:hypothetical protein HYW54_03695 [Candidatus Gottesmanbacteria bacterium]|nr:hypothetical protein [Candidatus Gottesmanbacteria bacterium]